MSAPRMSLPHDLARRVMGCAPALLHEGLTMQSSIRIFKLDEPKKGTSKKTGNPYEIHTAQAALVDAVGNIDTVGVLDIPPDLRGKVGPGVFIGTFAMKTNFQNGRIESVLTGLTPIVEAGAAPSKLVK